ncbi:MAG: DUF1015 family protein [Ilumatobacteraceae bacterium]
MAVFQPFRALRFAPDRLVDRVAPPYDVLTADDVRDLRRRGSVEVTRIDVPTVDGGDEPYDDARRMLTSWIDSGEVVLDDEPTFTICRMIFTDETGRSRRIDGVIGAIEVVDENAPGVLAHERTTPKASTDRLDLTRATKANLSPIWGLTSASGLTALLAEPGDDAGSVLWDGVEHRFEVIRDRDRCRQIVAALESADVLIADGHHRYGVARMFRDEVRQRTGRTDTDAELTLMFVNELVPDQLAVAAIHRVYEGLDVDEMLDALGPLFEPVETLQVDESTLTAIDRVGGVCVVDPTGTGTVLRPRPGVFDGIRELDGLRLEIALEGTNHEVSYQHGVNDVVARLREGVASVGVLIRPVPIDEIRRTADQRELMPPKSTFFTPKLLTGAVLRPMTLET